MSRTHNIEPVVQSPPTEDQLSDEFAVKRMHLIDLELSGASEAEIFMAKQELAATGRQIGKMAGNIVQGLVDIDHSTRSVTQRKATDTSINNFELTDCARSRVDTLPDDNDDSTPDENDTEKKYGSAGTAALSPSLLRAAEASLVTGPVLEEVLEQETQGVPFGTELTNTLDYATFYTTIFEQVFNGSVDPEAIPIPQTPLQIRKFNQAVQQLASDTPKEKKTDEWKDLFFELQMMKNK